MDPDSLDDMIFQFEDESSPYHEEEEPYHEESYHEDNHHESSHESNRGSRDPPGYDEFEEPDWGYEEDQRRVDDVSASFSDDTPEDSEENNAQTGKPDLEAAKHKKKEVETKTSSKASSTSTPLPPTQAPPPAQPTATAAPVPPAPVAQAPAVPAPIGPAPAQPPQAAQPQQPPVQKPQTPHPSQVPTDLPRPMPTMPMAGSSPADRAYPGPPAPIAPVAPAAPVNSPYGYSQDLGGLGQIGVFTENSASNMHRMDSLIFLLIFVYAFLYIRN